MFHVKIGHENVNETRTMQRHKILMVEQASSSLSQTNSDEKQKKIHAKLIECFEHHQEIITYCEEFSSAFMSVIFIQMGVSLFVLCFTLFLIMNIANGDILASTNVLPYFCTITYQLWQLCYTGNELSHDVSPFLKR